MVKLKVKNVILWEQFYKNGGILPLGDNMVSELNEWLKYLEKIESLVDNEELLTEYQKEDIEYTKNMIKKLEEEINEKNKKNN